MVWIDSVAHVKTKLGDWVSRAKGYRNATIEATVYITAWTISVYHISRLF